MRATLEFNLPEERAEHTMALRGHHYLAALRDLDTELRRRVKHGGDPELHCSEFRTLLRECAGEWSIDLDAEAE